MPQIFRPSTNSLSRISLAGLLLIVLLAIWMGYTLAASPYTTGVQYAREQPVQFSHQHHVQGMGLDCRFCHASVESSSSAGMPSTETCMSCHSQIWSRSEALAPVRQSFESAIPLAWNRVHDMPDFVYFNHSIHLQKGVGCSSCHGEVQRMPLVFKAQPMTMAWCLECHSKPELYVRPREEVFNMDWQPPPDQAARGQELVSAYKIDRERMMNCYACHR
jgi:hypothetical protein